MTVSAWAECRAEQSSVWITALRFSFHLWYASFLSPMPSTVSSSSGITGATVFAPCIALARFSVNAPCPVPASNISSRSVVGQFGSGTVGLRSRRETIRFASWEYIYCDAVRERYAKELNN